MRSPFLFLSVTALLTACGGKAAAPPGDGGPGAGEGGPPPSPVEVAVVRQQTVVDAITATGQIEAIQSIELHPSVEGRLVRILVQEGAAVTEGEILFKVDDAELNAELAQAEADRDLAAQALKRTQELIAKNASSAADLERAQAMAKSSEARVTLLKVRLDHTSVRAPFTGVAGQRFVSVGDYVSTSTRLISLQTFDPQHAAFAVPERYAQRLRSGQRVTFSVAAIPGRTFVGRVEFVDPVVQLPARTILVKAVVPNPGRVLQAGMFVEASLQAEVRPNALVVPEDAIVPLTGANFVWVVTEGKASRHDVKLGVRTAGFVEIDSGVSVGQQVVVGGQERLFEGAPVNPAVVNRPAP